MLRFRRRRTRRPAASGLGGRRRALLAFLLGSAGRPEQGAGGGARPSGNCLTRGDASLLHDRPLAPINDPVTFRPEFAAQRAGASGCSTSTEADFFEMHDAAGRRGAETQEAGDDVRREQYLDFLKGRSFRQTLLGARPRSAWTARRGRPRWCGGWRSHANRRGAAGERVVEGRGERGPVDAADRRPGGDRRAGAGRGERVAVRPRSGRASSDRSRTRSCRPTRRELPRASRVPAARGVARAPAARAAAGRALARVQGGARGELVTGNLVRHRSVRLSRTSPAASGLAHVDVRRGRDPGG